MSTAEQRNDAGSPSATKIAEAATKQLALEKAYTLMDRYVAEVAPDAPNPFTRETKDLKQPK
ncbi:MAG: hypothetical protein WA581_15470 [Candidatus Acidiferrales bacterium]